MRNFFLATLALFILLTPTQAETYKFDASKSEIIFEIGHFTGTARGEFSEFEGVLEFDDQNPEKSKVKLEIQVDSIDTGSAKRDQHLQEEDYFHSQKFPKITFQSQGFKQRGKNNYVVSGPLTIRGKSKNITLQVQLQGETEEWAVSGKVLNFQSSYELNRMDFGVSGGRPAVGKQVKITLLVKARESSKEGSAFVKGIETMYNVLDPAQAPARQGESLEGALMS